MLTEQERILETQEQVLETLDRLASLVELAKEEAERYDPFGLLETRLRQIEQTVQTVRDLAGVGKKRTRLTIAITDRPWLPGLPWPL